MMEKLVLVGVFGLTACAVETVEGEPIGDDPVFRDLADPDLVRSTREYIAMRDAGFGCPDIGHWTGKDVFDDHPDLSGPSFVAPPQLARYCRYTTDAASPDPTQLSPLGFAKLNPLTVGTMPQTIVREELGPMLEARYRWRYHEVPAADFAGTNANRFPVRLAIVDTQPNDVDGVALHGRIMTQLAETIACPEGPTNCRVMVEPELGLPRKADGTADWTNGGFHGGLSDSALGIISAVHRWQDTQPDSRLFISLALGIDPGVFEPASIDAEMNLIDDALRFAACHGATVLAAAGNDLRLGTTGALYPARLEEIAVPTPAQCANDFNVSYVSNDTGSYQPLVHAIGGLNDSFGLSPVTREDSLPRLVAPATHVVTADLEHVVTGTSAAVTTAVASAALLVSYDPSQGRSDVMQHLYDVGGATGELADLWYAGPQPWTRRVRLCNALQNVCTNNWRCGAMTFDCNQPIPATDAQLLAALEGIEARKVFPVSLAQKPVLCEDNGGVEEKLVYFADTNPAQCSDIDYQPMDAITEPQPDPPGCDTCGFVSGTNTLALQILDEFEDWTIDSVEATLWDDEGEDWDYHLGAPALTTRTITEVPLPSDERIPDVVARASITIHFSHHSGKERTTFDVLLLL